MKPMIFGVTLGAVVTGLWLFLIGDRLIGGLIEAVAHLLGR